eukprot:CAMPEP_0118659534 /NCGR_PEP_ID=MMETSP0785-20121206/15166_1 /TAXON_ID=91992 /ORGANISM="Bolidomonas pacifica, Strain CCMP 1866" /LENGTH=48 /DNA_ID= /DNA_START= /DNA_END= /DNA_ORIENTATION=
MSLTPMGAALSKLCLLRLCIAGGTNGGTSYGALWTAAQSTLTLILCLL